MINTFLGIRFCRRGLQLFGLLAISLNLFSQTEVSKYNVIWTSPGKNASDSMPAGNGEVGINVWVEDDGDLQFYISRTDAWSESCRLLKLGKIRISLNPNPFRKDNPFRQELKLEDGTIEITAGKDKQAIKLCLFVDAESPTIHILGESKTAYEVRATFETWRTNKKILKGEELDSSWTMKGAPQNISVEESPDMVLQDYENAVMWCHRNEDSIVPFTLNHQGIGKFYNLVSDPLLHRTFGGIITGKQFKKESAVSIITEKPAKQFQIQIATHSDQTDTLLEWQNALAQIMMKNANSKKAQSRTAEWWKKFWNKSWVFVEEKYQTSIPTNNYPLRIGGDSAGGNIYRGFISRLSLFDRPLSHNEIAKLYSTGYTNLVAVQGAAACWHFGNIENGVVKNLISQNYHLKINGEVFSTNYNDVKVGFFKSGIVETQNGQLFEFKNGFTLEGWIMPEKGLGAARIFDKVTAGVDDGFLFDTYPAKSLRLLVGNEKIIAKDCLIESEWNHIAATYDPHIGAMKIYLNGKVVASNTDEQTSQSTLSLITRAYILQRWMSACAGRGNYPIKFNGSIFTVDPKFGGASDFDPDWRRWGDCYWWQNTRLPYFAMLPNGDFDQMKPLFDFYLKNLSICNARAKYYYNADGVYFPETMTIFGTYSNNDYGWDRKGHKPDEVLSPWWRYAWQQGLELVTLMLDYYDYTQDKQFLLNKLVPMSREVLLYYFTRFTRDNNGKLVISPTQAVETYWYNVTNDTPSVAGLHDVINRLHKIRDQIPPTERELVSKMKKIIPDLPIVTSNGVSYLLPAQYFNPKRSNIENPELYAVFPFKLFHIGNTNVEIGWETFKRRMEKSMIGWSYDGQCAARLGITDEAKRQILFKVKNSNKNFRFPAMWEPNYDWVPDQDHGSNIMIVLQNMLMFDDGEKIHLFPAFPKDWNARFKLYASKNSLIECEYVNRKIIKLKISPESRKNDIVIHNN
ncbi:MAG: DUF5703 domain-containing protein [Verrucomicrobiia bacterium]